MLFKHRVHRIKWIALLGCVAIPFALIGYESYRMMFPFLFTSLICSRLNFHSFFFHGNDYPFLFLYFDLLSFPWKCSPLSFPLFWIARVFLCSTYLFFSFIFIFHHYLIFSENVISTVESHPRSFIYVFWT